MSKKSMVRKAFEIMHEIVQREKERSSPTDYEKPDKGL